MFRALWYSWLLADMEKKQTKNMFYFKFGMLQHLAQCMPRRGMMIRSGIKDIYLHVRYPKRVVGPLKKNHSYIFQPKYRNGNP